MITMLIWGTTYVSTKVLLVSFSPIEILLIRFLMGYLALWIVYPHRMKFQGWRQEIIYVLAGLTGIASYYLLENMALVYTLATNVGIIISMAPFFTAVLNWLVYKERRPSGYFLMGFVVAMSGISIITVGRADGVIAVNPLGDVLALLAAVVWAVTTSIYIYLVPVITATTSMVILHEPMTWVTVSGIVLTLSGSWLSGKKRKFECGCLK